jgi:hypothetical protein
MAKKKVTKKPMSHLDRFAESLMELDAALMKLEDLYIEMDQAGPGAE